MKVKRCLSTATGRDKALRAAHHSRLKITGSPQAAVAADGSSESGRAWSRHRHAPDRRRRAAAKFKFGAFRVIAPLY
jgi:hypothetical protein